MTFPPCRIHTHLSQPFFDFAERDNDASKSGPAGDKYFRRPLQESRATSKISSMAFILRAHVNSTASSFSYHFKLHVLLNIFKELNTPIILLHNLMLMQLILWKSRGIQVRISLERRLLEKFKANKDKSSKHGFTWWVFTSHPPDLETSDVLSWFMMNWQQRLNLMTKDYASTHPFQTIHIWPWGGHVGLNVARYSWLCHCVSTQLVVVSSGMVVTIPTYLHPFPFPWNIVLENGTQVKWKRWVHWTIADGRSLANNNHDNNKQNNANLVHWQWWLPWRSD